jgi:hypothetical protein
MIRELAEYEHELQWVTGKKTSCETGWGEHPRFCALVAEWDGRPAGYAVFFAYFSTWVERSLCTRDGERSFAISGGRHFSLAKLCKSWRRPLNEKEATQAA